jgi:hypothetical protein
MVLATNAFSAQVKNCKVEGTLVKNVVTLSDEGNKVVANILLSEKSNEEKKKLIKSALFVESVNIGDGNSVCDIAKKQYNVTEEKCSSVMRSRDLLELIVDDQSTDVALDCKIGVNAKLLMQFKM